MDGMMHIWTHKSFEKKNVIYIRWGTTLEDSVSAHQDGVLADRMVLPSSCHPSRSSYGLCSAHFELDFHQAARDARHESCRSHWIFPFQQTNDAALLA